MIAKTAAYGCVVWLLLAGVMAGPKDQGRETPWSQALASAGAAANTEPGEKYAKKVRKQIRATVSQADEACALVVSEPEEFEFVMLLRVGRTGAVEEMLVKPESAYALCQRVIAVLEVFPTPPSVPFWVEVELGKSR